MIGGGVYIDITSSYPCTVNISGGTIDQNRADYVGNDVYYPGNNQKFLYLSGEAQVNDLYLRSGIINISQPFTETGGINHLFIVSGRAGHTFAHLDYYSSPSDIFDLTAIQMNSTQESAWSINQSDADLYLLKNISALSIDYTSNLPYTGNEQVLSVSVYDADRLLTADNDYTISGNTGTVAGDYYCTIQGIGNYFGTSAPAWSIERAAPGVSDLNFSLDPVTYDGSAHPVSVTAKDSVLGLGSITVVYNTSRESPVSAGDYSISVQIGEGANYTPANLVLGNFVIGRAAPTENDLNFSLVPVTYDGSAHPVSVTPKDSVSGLGSITVLYNSSSAAPVSAGDYSISVQIGEGVNYTSANLDLGNFVLGRAAPTGNDLNFSLVPVTYDGSAHPVSVTAKDSVLGLGSMTVLYNNISAAPVSAGNYTISVRIDEGVNYTSANLDLGNFSLGKAAPTRNDLSYSLASSTYDGSAHPVSVTAKDSVLGLGSMTVLYNNSSAAPVSSGDYSISVEIEEGANYTSANFGLGDFVIGKAAPSVNDLNFSLDSVTYDGSAHPVSVTPNDTVLGLGSMTVYYNNSSAAPVSAGDYPISVEIEEGANYTSAEFGLGTFSLRKAAPTVNDLSFSLDSVTYDGSAHPVSVLPITGISGLGSMTVLYNNITAAPESAGDYSISVRIAEGENYNSADLDLGTFSLRKAAPTVTNLNFSLDPVTYDGSTHPVSVTPKDTVLGLGSMTVLYNTSTAAPVSAGDYSISARIDEGVNYTSVNLVLGTFVISPIYVPPSDDDDDDDEDYAYPTQTSSSTYIVNTSSTPAATPTMNLSSSPASTPAVKATFLPTQAASESNASFPLIGIIGGIVLAILVVIGGVILFIRRKV